MANLETCFRDQAARDSNPELPVHSRQSRNLNNGRNYFSRSTREIMRRDFARLSDSSVFAMGAVAGGMLVLVLHKFLIVNQDC